MVRVTLRTSIKTYSIRCARCYRTGLTRFREILEATKAEENHIKAVIVRMQREEIGLVNLGDQARAVWWLPDQEVLKRLIK